MKKLLILAASAGLGMCAYAQTHLSLADEMLLAEMRSKGASTLSAADAPALETTGILFRVADSQTVESLKAAGVNVIQQEGNIVIATIPLASVENALAISGVEDASLQRKRRLLNDLGVAATGVDKVHAGEGLDHPFDGTGVIAGIFDSGIDPNHVMFKDEDGNPRVSHFWNFVGYNGNYEEHAGDAVSNFNTDDMTESHGTHTMGSMAGCFKKLDSGKDYSGVATGAEIVAAGGSGYDANFTGSVRKIADYAKEQGKPCVINLSWGSNDDGPHDGTDAFTQALNNIAGEEHVHLFIASGNEGDQSLGVYKELTAEDNILRAFIEPDEFYTPQVGGSLCQGQGPISVWGDTAEPFNVYLDIVDLENPQEPIYSLNLVEGSKKFLSCGYSTPPGVTSSEIDRSVQEFSDHYSNSYMGGKLGVSPVNGCYRAEIAVDLKSSTRANFRSYSVAIRVEGAPGQKVHAYAGMSSTYNVPLLGFGDKEKPGYDKCIGDGTLNAMGCGDNMIAVGAYSTRQSEDRLSDTGEYIYAPEPEINQVVSFSSWGHMLDGTLKPDVLAPGYVIISSMNNYYVKYWGSSNLSSSRCGTPIKDGYTDKNGKTHYWTIMSGTSMATPHMAGVAALWLQANPELTTQDLLEVIRNTSYKPENAGDNWGPNGLVNAYEGLKYILRGSALECVGAEEDAILIQADGTSGYEICAPGANGIEASIFNIQGMKIYDGGSDNDTMHVDTSDLPAGVYVLSARTSRGTVSKKIMIN